MRNTLKAFEVGALARADVRREYDALAQEFELLDEILKARAEAGLTQAQAAGPDWYYSIRRGAARIRYRETFAIYRNTQTLRFGSGVSPAGPACQRSGFNELLNTARKSGARRLARSVGGLGHRTF